MIGSTNSLITNSNFPKVNALDGIEYIDFPKVNAFDGIECIDFPKVNAFDGIECIDFIDRTPKKLPPALILLTRHYPTIHLH